ncbi:MAG: NAD(P)/FAD-dependent oxidoreductase [Proteobacteria bacterium]|nr:NAD(P)/FAD-dependent oxidoreductase [Pseudomonadota bacterium]
MADRPRVIVVGGGFAGLSAVRALARAPVDVLLIDRCNHHTFQPLLYQVATAGLAAPSIAAPLRHILRQQRNVTVYLGDVQGVDALAHTVTVNEQRHGYDYLVLATGTTHAYFGHEQWAGHAPGLKTLEDAFVIRARILNAFEQAEMSVDEAARAAWLSFVVVGGGPTGVELAGTLAEIARHTLKQEFRHIEPARSRVRLIEAGPRVLPAFPPKLSAAAQRQLERLGVEVATGHAITEVSAEGVRVGGQSIAARTVLWAAGVAASPLGRLAGAQLDRVGRVQVAADLSVPAHPDIFIAGDLASIAGPHGPVPGIAPAAKQMGRHVARAIEARLAGRAASAFRYHHHGLLATVGRMAAVVDLGWLRLTGLVAWWFWLMAHIYFLIGFRNRLVVLIDWAAAYFTYERGARIIVRSDQRE